MCNKLKCIKMRLKQLHMEEFTGAQSKVDMWQSKLQFTQEVLASNPGNSEAQCLETITIG